MLNSLCRCCGPGGDVREGDDTDPEPPGGDQHSHPPRHTPQARVSCKLRTVGLGQKLRSGIKSFNFGFCNFYASLVG